MSVHRQERLAREISRGVADIIQHELNDPRLGFISVTRTAVSRDLKHARVFISVMGDDKKKKLSMQGLRHAGGFVRRGLAGRLCIRECPTLDFSLDDSIDRTFSITKILDEIITEPKREEE